MRASYFLLLDAFISLTSSIYNTSETDEYLDVCAIIVSGYLEISVFVYISTYSNETTKG